MIETNRPSAWARERFGDAAEDLLREIPAALLAAHRRAYDSYVGLGVQTKEAYGLIWKVQHEELVARLRGLEGARVFKPRGARYELVMIDNVVLYPWRYADGNLTPLEYAQMKLSDIRRTLLSLTDDTEADEQLPLDSAATPDEELEAEREQAREETRQLLAGLRVVLIAYASNPHSGILSTEWGDPAGADENGRVNWLHHESLPVLAGEEGGQQGGGEVGGSPAPIRPVAPAGGNGSAGRRFDDAPMAEPLLAPKVSTTSVNSEKQEKAPETGTNQAGKGPRDRNQ